jgi:hypothetical protein
MTDAGGSSHLLMETRASVDANGCGVHVDIADQILVLGVMIIFGSFQGGEQVAEVLFKNRVVCE